MRSLRGRSARYAFVPLAWSSAAEAHSFGRPYNLPVPFWMYAWGAASALLLSFFVVGWIVARRPSEPDLLVRDVSDEPAVRVFRERGGLAAAKALSLGALLLCIATGLFGTRNPYLNINMTLFWIVFLLGFTYLVALAGDLYSVVNPWQVLVDVVRYQFAGAFRGRFRYPAWLGCWPALAFYIGFVWIELFGGIQPSSLAVMLLAYSAINLCGAWLVGARDWFRHCEFFGVFFCLIGRMAPLEYAPGAERVRLRLPLGGLVQDPAQSLGEVVFILFMLSSTAFDGLHVTETWRRFFWVHLWQALQPWLSSNIVVAYPTLKTLDLAYETLALVASPFVYLTVYLAFLWMAKSLTRSPRTLRALALSFANSLLPIALVYNVTHYYTSILTQGVQVVRLASDPFGFGWNLFGTARGLAAPIVLDAGAVWHTQVGLILVGHVLAVFFAHLEALRVFSNRRAAVVSQLPMLALMVLLTTVGLWILAQPIQSGA